MTEQTKAHRLHPALRCMLALLGSFCTLVAILSGMAIWIYFFDSEGAESGTATIFGSIPFLPVFVLLIITAGVVSYRSVRMFLVVLIISLTCFGFAAVTAKLSRDENAR